MKRMTGDLRSRMAAIKGKLGSTPNEIGKIKERWKEYTKELHG